MRRKVFVGEIELTKAFRARDFERFESSPLIQLVHKLARRFTGFIEIMPYQRQGETLKLTLAVYLTPKAVSGRIIVILVKEDYPRDAKALRTLVQKARSRIETLAKRTSEFDERSLSAARTRVDELVRAVIDATH